MRRSQRTEQTPGWGASSISWERCKCPLWRRKELIFRTHLSHLGVQTLTQGAPVDVVQNAAAVAASPRSRRRPARRPCVTQTTQTRVMSGTRRHTGRSLTCWGHTPCFNDSPSFLSRTFLESVGAELPPALFLVLPFGSVASDLVGFFFISDTKKRLSSLEKRFDSTRKWF